MKTLHSKFITSILSLCALTTMPLLTTVLTACSNDGTSGDIELINLVKSFDYVIKGESLKIDTEIEPYSARNKKLLWEIITPTEGVSISEDGVVSVDQSFSLTNPTQIFVQASDPDNFGVSGVTDLIVAPSGTSPMLGFVNGTIGFYDKYGDEKYVNIVTQDNINYYTDAYVDFFANDTSASIMLEPVFKKFVNKKMKFHILGDETVVHGISWVGYFDNSWTDTIPTISANYASCHRETIEISFACDTIIRLYISCNIWNTRQSETISPPTITYTPTADDDHHLYLEVDSVYSMNLHFHPDLIHRDKMSTFYIWKPAYDYLDFINFQIRPVNGGEETKYYKFVKDQVTLNPIYVERESDGYPAYQITLDYISFDSEIFNPVDVDYKNIPLFEIIAYDRARPNVITIRFKIYLDWSN